MELGVKLVVVMAECRYWKMSKGQAERMLNCAMSFQLVKHRNDSKHEPEILLQKRSEEKWAIVVDGVEVLNSNGDLEYEPMPSNREDDFLKRTRFSLEKAWALAEEFARKNNLKLAYEK